MFFDFLMDVYGLGLSGDAVKSKARFLSWRPVSALDRNGSMRGKKIYGVLEHIMKNSLTAG